MKIIELGNIVLSINAEVFNRLLSFIQNKNSTPESGGILMGYYIDDYSFVITDISTPSTQDKSTRFNFIRSFKTAQNFIIQRFNNSQGKKIYLGEWHTHPENYPTPSYTDLNSFENQIKSNKLNSKIVFMIIVGIKGLYLASYCKKGLLNNINLISEKI